MTTNTWRVYDELLPYVHSVIVVHPPHVALITRAQVMTDKIAASHLARHVQPSELIPQPIHWRQAPDTWWRLVEEISILAFTTPQWDYTPAVGQRVGVDRECALPIQ
jgi:hypothetical protein